MYTIPQNLALNVNLSCCLDLMTLNFRKIVVGHFSNDFKGHLRVIQAITTKIVTFS